MPAESVFKFHVVFYGKSDKLLKESVKNGNLGYIMDKDLIDNIFEIDCFDLLNKIPDGSVDLILTDPPYRQEAHGRGIAKCRKVFIEMQEWTNLNVEWYKPEFLDLLLKKCKYPNLFIFGGKRDQFDVMKYAEANKLNFYQLPIIKSNPIPTTNNTWLPSEGAIHVTDRKITKSKDYRDKIPYFLVGQNKETSHPNEKNLDMVMRIIKNLTDPGELVVDVFGGSGTTAVACKRLGRHYIVGEKNPEFVKMAKERLLQGELF